MAVLVTGASGFVGTVLIKELLKKGHKVYGLSRHPPAPAENLIPVQGNILHQNLRFDKGPRLSIGKDIEAVYHLAGSHSLGEDKDGSIWQLNVTGTQNVLAFCIKNDIPHLFFTSTAYAWEVNPYGLSKIKNEEDIREYSERYGLKTTIFKPSIILGTAEYPYPGHFSQFVSVLIKTLQKVGLLKATVEDKLGLPILQFTLRIKGNPEGKLNLVTVDAVAEAMASIEEEGTFWLTNPDPPLLKDLVRWVGELIAFDFRIVPEFKPRPLESQFMQMVSAFEPYLQGDNFPSDLKGHLSITKQFILDTIKRSLG